MMTTFSAKLFYRITFQVLVCTLLAGCLSSVKLPTTNNYFLNTLPEVPTYSRHATSIVVATPEVREAFNTTQMAYSLNQYQISYYGLNNWAEMPGGMIEPLIVQALQNTHYFHAVISPPYMGQYDYLLRTELLDLRQDYSHGYRAFRVSIRAQLISAATGRVIATKLINTSEPIPACNPFSGVQAGNRAMARAIRELAIFSVTRL